MHLCMGMGMAAWNQLHAFSKRQRSAHCQRLPAAGVIKAASRSNQSIYSLIDCFADNPLQALQ